MQTGTTPARRTATEPASDRSAPPTGPCRTASPTGSGKPSLAATATVSEEPELFDAGVAA
ncbi:hypothetical protein CK500_01875 [Halorubrum salipaludis]|uniref:Uncharacterized protein n=1 Tax=Halorubrum salipaludis TaxID=2032630 RepID=A0A2A2FLK0_9EURY|nr:hypothetical protein [Halorubrum salipaludis]PAU85443.1 hypothetical protein CK500_01875 [Halorubrum salipaludis]